MNPFYLSEDGLPIFFKLNKFKSQIFAQQKICLCCYRFTNIKCFQKSKVKQPVHGYKIKQNSVSVNCATLELQLFLFVQLKCFSFSLFFFFYLPTIDMN